ncbi:LLM class flavin-dependent oxidoreductase [Hyphomicrobium sp.]|uniref:LLM class flavin-dependent oxidoreductase n=1 Tax=Hyphomicrobium sp. TaxID=82 RepID=UPI001D863169|nr:LLM class flavin-dependent oxidoreductase [Hyphomicrobium sp.]MBY0558818.1 LLM class flavin-dependent oxidoreductase [Hyphomicrobium sp.]
MKIGLIQEGEVMPGNTVAQRYDEMIAEVELADRVGFHCWGTSEQHFTPPRFSVAAPEILYAAIARQTKNIKLRIMCSVLLQWNHPILVAERLATLDIVSKGRAELATARSNNLTTLAAFGVDPSQTRTQWEDSMAVLAKIFEKEYIEHDGPVWKIPRVPILPRCIQSPNPPIFVAASSAQSHKNAGEIGIGVISFDNYFGFDYLRECIDAYRSGAAEAAGRSLMPKRTDLLSVLIITAFCAQSKQDAVNKARDISLGYFNFILDLYAPLGKKISYEYLDKKILRLLDHRTDMDFLLTETPSVLVGTPDEFIKRLRLLEELGVEEVVMRIDGMPHEDIMRSIELIGREVIPAFKRTRELI